MTFSTNNNPATELAKRSSDLIAAISGEVKRGRGRPKGSGTYKPEDYEDEIVSRLMCGESLAMICADNNMPSLRTVTGWQTHDSDFHDRIDAARHTGISNLMDACVGIACGDKLSTGSIERDKLLVSVIKWIVEKRHPQALLRSHGEKFEIIIRPDDLDIC